MKNILWMAGGVCGAVAGFLLWGASRERPVERLAHQLEDAWVDHHTVA